MISLQQQRRAKQTRDLQCRAARPQPCPPVVSYLEVASSSGSGWCDTTILVGSNTSDCPAIVEDRGWSRSPQTKSILLRDAVRSVCGRVVTRVQLARAPTSTPNAAIKPLLQLWHVRTTHVHTCATHVCNAHACFRTRPAGRCFGCVDVPRFSFVIATVQIPLVQKQLYQGSSEHRFLELLSACVRRDPARQQHDVGQRGCQRGAGTVRFLRQRLNSRTSPNS